MKRLIAAFLLIVALMPPAAQAEDKTTMTLGGPRKVVAEITEDGDNLIVAIKMLAVRTFDNATNLRLNRDKGRQYANVAVAKFLFPDAKGRVTFTLSGSTVELAKVDGKRFLLRLRVPRNGVNRKEVAQVPAKTPDELVSASVDEPVTKPSPAKRPAKINLFEVKGDYAETERLLFESFTAAIPVIPEKPDEDQRNSFFKAIADLEEQADESFDRLVAEMRENRLLLKTEADEVAQQIERDRSELMELLKKAVEAAEPPSSSK